MQYIQHEELTCNSSFNSPEKKFGFIFNECVLKGDTSLHNVSLGSSLEALCRRLFTCAAISVPISNLRDGATGTIQIITKRSGMLNIKTMDHQQTLPKGLIGQGN
jgi:hypothetical protein